MRTQPTATTPTDLITINRQALVRLVEEILSERLSDRHETPEEILSERLSDRHETPEGIRLEKRMGVEDLAYTSGISRPTIYRIENGEVGRLQAETLNRIAKGLGVQYERYARAAAFVRRRSGGNR